MRGQAFNQVYPPPEIYAIQHWGHGMISSVMVLKRR